MLGTLLRRVTIKTLDAVVDRGERSTREPVRLVARTLDRARGLVGLDQIAPRHEMPQWDGSPVDVPMWDSDRKKLHKFRVDKGIIKEEGAEADAEAEAPEAPVKIYFRRGCPYTRAAMDLLRERELEFDQQDVTMDEVTQGWLRIESGQNTTPWVFIHGVFIGGFDDLRTLDQKDELRGRIEAGPPEIEFDELDEVREIEAREVLGRVRSGTSVLLLDVRNDDEVRAGMLAHAVHIPLDELERRATELDPEGLWVVYCRSGKRSVTAAETLNSKGFASVASMAGGIEAWRAAGGAVAGFGDTEARKTTGRGGPIRLNVLGQHPEQSPFEGLRDEFDGPTERLEGDALVERVKEVLDECRPMVRADGGDIELLDVLGDVVHIELTGNCVGCPSSQATLKQGIERRLKNRIPQIEGIESPNLQPA